MIFSEGFWELEIEDDTFVLSHLRNTPDAEVMITCKSYLKELLVLLKRVEEHLEEE